MAVTATFPVAPGYNAWSRELQPRVIVTHRSDDTPAQAALAAARAASLVRMFAYAATLQDAIDPHEVLDDDQPFREMRCPGTMTRFLRLHGMDVDQLGDATGSIGGRSGWNIGSDIRLGIQVEHLTGLPAHVPAFSFCPREGWVGGFSTRLAPDIVLIAGTILIENTVLPQTQICAMGGLLAHDVIRHPLLDSPTLTIRTASADDTGTVICLDMRDDGDVIGGYDRYLPEPNDTEGT